jgi:hypothetical protein
MSISATLQSWTETIGLAFGGVTLAILGVLESRPWPGSPLVPDSSA